MGEFYHKGDRQGKSRVEKIWSNGFDYPKSTTAGTTVLEKVGEKGAQGTLLDRVGVDEGLGYGA